MALLALPRGPKARKARAIMSMQSCIKMQAMMKFSKALEVMILATVEHSSSLARALASKLGQVLKRCCRLGPSLRAAG